jgi:hypothetical protein
LEIVIEIVVQILGEALFELGAEGTRDATRPQRKARPLLSCIGYLIFGALLGGASAFIWSRRAMPEPIAILNLVVGPAIVGVAMHVLGDRQRRRGKPTTNLATFWGGASLSFGTMLARFILASSP